MQYYGIHYVFIVILQKLLFKNIYITNFKVVEDKSNSLMLKCYTLLFQLLCTCMKIIEIKF